MGLGVVVGPYVVDELVEVVVVDVQGAAVVEVVAGPDVVVVEVVPNGEVVEVEVVDDVVDVVQAPIATDP
jgi:hypothetical protein